jgi:hypothetical protein
MGRFFRLALLVSHFWRGGVSEKMNRTATIFMTNCRTVYGSF